MEIYGMAKIVGCVGCKYDEDLDEKVGCTHPVS